MSSTSMSSSSTAPVTDQSKIDYIEKVFENFQDRLCRLIAALPVKESVYTEDKELGKAYIFTAAVYEAKGHFTEENYEEIKDSFAYIAQCEKVTIDARILAASLILSLSCVMDSLSALALIALGKRFEKRNL